MLRTDQWASELFPCPSGISKTPDDFQPIDYRKVAFKLHEYYDDAKAKDYKAEGLMAGCVLRMAGHDFMDYRMHDGVETGGSDGCIHFSDVANGGLIKCLTEYKIPEAYAEVCDRVSLADFFVIAGETMVARTTKAAHNDGDHFAVGTMAQDFRQRFKFGR